MNVCMASDDGVFSFINLLWNLVFLYLEYEFLRSAHGCDVAFWVLLGFWRKGVSCCLLFMYECWRIPVFF